MPFFTIGNNTADIQSIKISDDNAGGIGWGGENFSVWEGVPTVVEGSGFQYCDASLDPSEMATDYYWGDVDGNKAVFSIAPGQAAVIECAEGLTVTTAGSVPTEAVSFTTIEQNNFTGNPFPVSIDIQSIKISDDNAGGIGWGGENFSVWEGVPVVVEGSGFQYCDASLDPSEEATDYYWGDVDGNKATYEIPSGQGVVIECAAGLMVTITPPYSL